MRKLFIILVTFIAVVTFIRAFDNTGSAEIAPAVSESGPDYINPK